MPTTPVKRKTRDPQISTAKSVLVVVETPRGCRNKFKYEPQRKQFTLSKVLPAGSAFPYDFGFIPNTQAEDGDPIDVLMLMDEPAFPGCIVSARLVGVIEAEQTEADGTTVRNDRLVAVADEAHDYRNIHSLKDVNDNLLKELEHFFVSYHEMHGNTFRILDLRGPKRAWKRLQKASEKYRGRKSRK
jgi:inorganic pyrophosphatase